MPTHKQGSKSMGEKIANPDYADPSKLFPNSCSSSTTNLSIHEIDAAESLVYDMMGVPEELDMTINEKDVLKEIDERLKERSTLFAEKPVPDTGQQVFISSVHASSHNNCGNKTVLNNKSDSKIKRFNSSQNSDSFYEAIMEKNLNEENSRDVTTKKEFEPHDQNNDVSKETKNRTNMKPVLKRPTKAPPPIPVKPKGLANLSNDKLKNGLHISSETDSKTFVSIKSTTVVNGEPNSRSSIQTNGTYSRSWVKAMVGRFDDENNN